MPDDFAKMGMGTQVCFYVVKMVGFFKKQDYCISRPVFFKKWPEV